MNKIWELVMNKYSAVMLLLKSKLPPSHDHLRTKSQLYINTNGLKKDT